MRINAADVSKIVRDPHADPHIHENNPEIYLAVTPNRGDIIIEVQMEDEIFTVESPFAVFVPPGVMHCFTETEEAADQAMALGFYISFSGIVTFKKALELLNILNIAPYCDVGQAA